MAQKTCYFCLETHAFAAATVWPDASATDQAALDESYLGIPFNQYPLEAHAFAAATVWPDSPATYQITLDEGNLGRDVGIPFDQYPPEAHAFAAATVWPDVPAVGQVTPGEILLDGKIGLPNAPVEPLHPNSAEQNIPEPALQEELPRKIVNTPKAFDCGPLCAGKFRGHHKCFRNGKSFRFECAARGCSAIFKVKNDFNRHVTTVHSGARKVLLDCPFEGCSRVGRKGFTRRDNLIAHRRGVHREEILKVEYRFGVEAGAVGAE